MSKQDDATSLEERVTTGAPTDAESSRPNGASQASSCQAAVMPTDNEKEGQAAGRRNNLAPSHLAMLRDGSSISDEVIQARGYRTVTEKSELNALGFAPGQQRVPGLLLPLHTTDGGNTYYVYRPDTPRVVEQRRGGKLPDGTYPCKVIKYEVPKGSGIRVDCPPACRPMLANPRIPLWMTEGQKKADSLASRGLCAIDLLGVWNFKGKNKFGGTTLLADFDHIAWKGRDVRIVFDSDVMTKPDVRNALDRLKVHLQRKKAHVAAVYLPGGPGSKLGVDDWFALGHTAEELETLVEAPRPEPRPAAPIVELLDAPPSTMRRPLALADGRAYAAAWLYVQVTTTEGTDKSGNIVKYDPPRVENCRQLFVVRDDGVLSGNGAATPIDELGLEVVLPETPPESRTWGALGVKRYLAGQRSDPVDVFYRIVDVVNRFVDFHRSLADQQTMAEVVACYILATWFLPAFTVMGYLWPNGDRGSGKTVLLHVVAEMAYLGQVILAGGSYATLRDLADYGATLAFDDAENLRDPRKSDPDKRTLLLAGNRRGTVITVKEPAPDKTWRTRYVDAFCPRLFSAIRLPDNVLASRSIIIPLIRTPDRYRANTDPLDYDEWPHDRRMLIDDLWALALTHLTEMQSHDKAVGSEARLTGRNLEPWRAILVLAHWLDAQDGDERLRRIFNYLDEHGEHESQGGLFERVERLSLGYQSERPELEFDDFTTLVIRALCANCANHANSANHGESPLFTVTSAAIANEAKAIAEEEEMPIKHERITPQRVGMTLRKMRLKKPPRSGGQGPRKWEAALHDLQRLTTAYGLKLPAKLQKLLDTPDEAGSVGTPGTVGTDDEDLWGGEL